MLWRAGSPLDPQVQEQPGFIRRARRIHPFCAERSLFMQLSGEGGT